MHIKITIFFLIIKTIYCNENSFKDLSYVYYVGRFEHLIKTFTKISSIDQKYYRLSVDGAYKVAKKQIWHGIYSCFYATKTPYIFLDQEDVECSKEKHGNYCSRYCHCAHAFKGVCFTTAPHFGDLAFCIRQANSGADKDDLLNLLDASYEVQKLLPPHTEDFAKMCHSVNLRSEIGPLINAFYNNTYSIYTFDSYKNDFQEVLQQATIFYSISVLKNLFLLFLLTNHMSNMFLTYSLYGTISFLIFLDIMNLGMHVNVKVGMCNFITVVFLFLLHENMLNDTICYYSKVLCTYWIAHSSFYFIKLYFKYDTFKKSMNDYEKNYKIPLLLKDQREKLTVLF